MKWKDRNMVINKNDRETASKHFSSKREEQNIEIDREKRKLPINHEASFRWKIVKWFVSLFCSVCCFNVFCGVWEETRS